jgi:hypothetical protein
MTFTTERSSENQMMRGRALLAAISGLAVLLAAAALMVAGSDRFDIMPVVWVFAVAFAFNALSLVVRWLLTTSRGRINLLGKFPVALALAKLCGLIAIGALVLTWLASFVVAPSFASQALRAAILGMVAFAALSSAANGLLNFIIVARHHSGTLATTSRAPRK